MKWISSPDSARGISLRTKMALLFLAASATILTLTVVGLVLLLHGNDGSQPSVLSSGIQLFDDRGPAFLFLILPAVTGICLVAWLSSSIIGSVTRSLTDCARFARTVSEGRLDERLPMTGNAEADRLAASLNDMAAAFQRGLSRISALSGALTSIDATLETDSARMAHSLRLQEAEIRRTAPAVARMEQTLGELSNGMESLLTSASASADTSRHMVAGSERMTTIGDSLGASVDEIRGSQTGIAACSRTLGPTIADLLAASGAVATCGAQMDAATRQVEKSARETRAIAEGVTGDAETGRRVAEEAVAGMQAIRAASAATAEAVKNLSQRTGDIDAILSVIEDVAEQTDLLALNATIIAAQAGDLGRDFSVVADEIRELAERTSSSTREIGAVIHGVQQETRRAVDAIMQVEERSAAGEKLTRHAGMALGMIISGVQQAALQAEGVARSGMEQARASRDITDYMQQISGMAQRMADSSADQGRLSEQGISAVERMGELTAQLRSTLREQRHGSSLALQAAGNLANGIRLLRDVGVPPSAAATTPQAAIAASGDALTALDESLKALARQIRLLKEELSGFMP